MTKHIFCLICFSFFFALAINAQAQHAALSGTVTSNGKPVPFASVYIESGTQGTDTGIDGTYELAVPAGDLTIIAQSQGYRTFQKAISFSAGTDQKLDIDLIEDGLGLDQIVVSATRDRVPKDRTPVVVNTLNPKLFRASNSITISESLNYTPGVRLETNCQNCNTTQVRMNGLEGRYSQILVNSRPIFSALNGVYGLESIPTAILDRVEVVRSGGSALYGSNAIAGTINIITKEPVLNSWEINSNLGFLGGKSPDRSLSFNASVVADDLSSGITTYGLFRDRDGFDANGDGFSEKTELQSNTLGLNAFLRPDDNSDIHFDVTATKDFRRGGDRFNTPPQFVDIAEQLDHNKIMGGITYDTHSDDLSNKFSVYASAQHVDRKSFYGGLFGGRTRQDTISSGDSFGTTSDLTVVGGAKYIHTFNEDNIVTVGAEYKLNKVDDETPGFNKVNIQDVSSYGLYAQYTWKPFKDFTSLLGARLDNVNVDGAYTVGDISTGSDANVTVLSPRITILYNITDDLKFRGGYARGFQAPQAYDENFEVSSAGGLRQFTIIADDLDTEFSNSYTGSLNFTKVFNKTQTNFLIEGFYTELQNTFTTVSTGQALANSVLLNEIQNGSGAYVTGVNFDLGVSPSSRFTASIGGTVQKAAYKEEQILFETDPENTARGNVVVDEYTRTPNFYGYLSLNTVPFKETNLDFTGTYTGNMVVPHVIDDTGYLDLVDTNPFFDLNVKLSHHFELTDTFHVTVNTGVQNVFNSYQDDFDKGPTRDSDYIYGPASPRTYFFGITFGNL